MPQDNEFTAEVPFVQDPEFIRLERSLQLRQEQERNDLITRQQEERILYSREPGVTREQLDDAYRHQLQEREAQSDRHKSEHDRYVRQYHDAKVLRDQLEQDEAKQEDFGKDMSEGFEP